MAVGQRQAVTYRDLFAEVIPAKATINVASLADGAGATEAVSVPGAALGDFVRVSSVIDVQDMTLTAYVNAANSVEIRVQNESGGVIDLASAVFHLIVEKPGRAFEAL